MSVQNWPSIRAKRLRVVAENSCPVCEGDRVVGLVAVADLAIPTPCWHCQLGEDSIPLFPQNNIDTSRSA